MARKPRVKKNRSLDSMEDWRAKTPEQRRLEAEANEWLQGKSRTPRPARKSTAQPKKKFEPGQPRRMPRFE